MCNEERQKRIIESEVKTLKQLLQKYAPITNEEKSNG